MNKFLIFWTLVSPACFGLVFYGLRWYPSSWSPTPQHIRVSIAIYTTYWILVGVLQAVVLLWQYQDKHLAQRWALTTSITGTLVMLSHDVGLALTGVDARGQGALILLMSLPFLASLGGFVLGLAQYFLIRDRCRSNLAQWLAMSFVSWMSGFAAIWVSSMGNSLSILMLLIAAGTALKGWFIQRNLRALKVD